MGGKEYPKKMKFTLPAQTLQRKKSLEILPESSRH